MSQQEFAQPSGQASRRWLAVIVAAFLVVGLIYSVVVPLFEAPDEVWHFAFADHLAKGGGLPVLSGTKSVFLREGGQPPLYYAVVALAIAPFDRNDFPGWVRSTPVTRPSHPAQRATRRMFLSIRRGKTHGRAVSWRFTWRGWSRSCSGR